METALHSHFIDFFICVIDLCWLLPHMGAVNTTEVRAGQKLKNGWLKENERVLRGKTQLCVKKKRRSGIEKVSTRLHEEDVK